MKRCPWPGNNLLMIKYHDEEWGVPLHDDKKIFEFFVLDTFQAGLSWEIVLKKREGFRKAFDNFDFRKIAKYTEKDFERLRNDERIIRNRAKIRATIVNAKRFLEVKKDYGSFGKYIWQFVNNKPIKNKWKNIKELPTTSMESDAMSIDLKKRGFKFAGSTICYAFMQAAGMVNDHLTGCFRYKEISDS
ncbi:DNA-3-methyladenine glycosylase I [Candidatus Pacearchaeota archaeon]|nr:DNA-3-methyladenine glycosylase I [Candidatus Pacearchaeota archaeon]